MKVHIGVDSQTGLIHSASVTPGNVHELHHLEDGKPEEPQFVFQGKHRIVLITYPEERALMNAFMRN